MSKKLSAAAGYEDSRLDRDPPSTELRPANDVFERQTDDSLLDHGGEFGRRLCGGVEQLGFLFGEDTTGVSQRCDDVSVHKFPTFHIKSKYGTTHINLVTHSQGGVVALDYMEHHLDDVHVDNWAPLAVPFAGGTNVNFSELKEGYLNVQLGIFTNENLIPGEADYEDSIYEQTHRLAIAALQNTKVFIGHGTNDSHGSYDSATAIYELPNAGLTVKEYDTDHSGIHELDQAIKGVNDFLFN